MANHLPAPPAIAINGDAPAVFVHFVAARHRIELDVSKSKRTMTVKSDITFEVTQYGRPVIDLCPAAGAVAQYFIDGKPMRTEEVIAPYVRDENQVREAGVFRVVDDTFEPGVYHAHITYVLSGGDAPGVSWGDGSVRLFFKMSDYFPVEERHFLERYLPANAEFDQHPMQIDIQIVGTEKAHRLVANGAISGDLATQFSVAFPDWYSCSCPFVYLDLREKIFAWEFTVPRGQGGSLPVALFAAAQKTDAEFLAYEGKVRAALGRLDTEIGPFPHDRLIVMLDEEGMEYAGAVCTFPEVVEHELVHCYFGRSVLPINGDAGWIDEAIAHWYTERSSIPQKVPAPGPLNIGAMSPLRRDTVPNHGLQGMDILLHLDGEHPGRLVPFLKKLHKDHARSRIDSNRLQLELEAFLGESLGELFDSCVYDLA